MAHERSRIECPACGHSFSVTEAMAGEIEKDVDQRVRQELDREKASLASKLKQELTKQMSLEIQDLKSQVEERDKKLEEATKHELQLRKKTRELEEKEKQLELELQRKLDAQRLAMEEELRKRISEDFQIKLNEKDLKLEGMTKKIEELKRKAEQGSQQTQGEAFEREIEKVLAAKFPLDIIEEVQKGRRGADVLHSVISHDGKEAGKILHEAKNTKTWNNDWIGKAKDDRRNAKAEFVIIVTEVLPKEVFRFDMIDGVWVTDFASFPMLALALRYHLVDLHKARIAALGKGEKLDCLYQYVTETQFRQRIEAIIEGFQMMRESLNREKAAMQRLWSQREQCLEQVIANTSGMYGDIQGIIGSSLPRIPHLELEPGNLLESGDDETN